MPIIPHQTFDDYTKTPGFNFSSLKALQVSDRAFVHALRRSSTPTDEMDKGSYLHSLLLDPHTILHKYAIWKGGRRAGTAWTSFAEANKDFTILNAEDADEIGKWAVMCQNDEIVGPELAAITQRELTITWTDSRTSLPCKARIDATYGQMIVDLKSTAKPTPEDFETDAMRRYYPAQMAMYIDGMAETTNTKPSAWAARIICVFKGDTSGQYPPDCWAMDLSEEVIEHGRRMYRGWLARAATIDRDKATGAGYGKIQTMILPAWAERQLPMPPITVGSDGEVLVF